MATWPAHDAAEEIAQRIWETRDEFIRPAARHRGDPAGAGHAERPVIIAEVSDNSGGGAPADGTDLLRAMFDASSGGCFGFIYDPATAAKAHAAGVGATISVALAAKPIQPCMARRLRPPPT